MTHRMYSNKTWKIENRFCERSMVFGAPKTLRIDMVDKICDTAEVTMVRCDTADAIIV